jgi:hypothetical protein
MWWQDLLWGPWNGITAWVILIAHAFSAREYYPLYDTARGGNWYDFGFLLGSGAPLLGRRPAAASYDRYQRGALSAREWAVAMTEA